MQANKNLSEKVITKQFLNMVAKFNEDLKAFAKESGEEANQEAAADLVKTAAAVAFGFIGFYLIFAIFGI